MCIYRIPEIKRAEKKGNENAKRRMDTDSKGTESKLHQ